ncbi:MAG: hypothetical protein IKC70_04130 [Bacteroidaceae bacterium]|nr:hypothetical protein [Bacteroidaceae bacterium]
MMRLFVVFLFALLVGGCTSTRYVPVETVRVDSVFIAKVVRDSIYERDSVFVETKADTVFKQCLKYVYRDRIVRDTVSVVRCDTVAKIVEVEKRLSFWQQKKLELGGAALWIVPLLAGIIIFIKR